MQGRQCVPEDLARWAPGPELACTLATLDPARLTGRDAVEVLRARYRQVAHEQGRYLELTAEVGCRDEPDTLARTEPGEFAAEEARAALTLTRRRADDEFWFAHDLLTRLPAVHAAMLAGDCDRPRAWIFADWTRDLTDEQARAVADRLLPGVAAGDLTTGKLIERIKKLAIALDPEWARRRYEHALAERKVVGSRNPDGTANLSGYNLPVDRVAAAAEHIDRLAKAAKRAGSGRLLDHLRSELFLGMTDGAYTGLIDEDIIAVLLANEDDDPMKPDKTAEHPAADTAKPADSAGSAADSDVTDPDPDAPYGHDRDPVTSGAAERAEPTTQAACGGRGGIELRMPLSTLLGHDQHPAELAGWGPVHAELARDLAARIARDEWRWLVTDTHGQLIDCGIIRARPAGSLRSGPRTRDVLELQLPRTLLDDPGEQGAWAPVLADIARQHAATDTDTGDDRFATDAYRRRPGAAQRRWLQMRDRHCLGRGCRVPARENEQDHTVAHSSGGLTLDGNLGGLCAHDHRLKSEGGWVLTQPEAGGFEWHSRLGHIYPVPPRPVIDDLPDPLPREPDPYPGSLPSEDDWEQDKILHDRPQEPEPEPPPPVARNDPDEAPPF